MSSSSMSDRNIGRRRKKKIPTEDSSSTMITTANASPAVAQSVSSSSTIYEAKENLISKQVPQNKRKEIYEYLKLFGYKPDRTILQVHITGFFKKKKYSQRELEKYKSAVKRYGGTTFVIV